MAKTRCPWAEGDALMRDYHDQEWGVPLRDEQRLFEFLVLEGVQAGLSWSTVLKKRENYRQAMDGFDPHKIARYGKRKIEALMNNAGLIRNRLKINAAVGNARAFLDVQQEFGTFSGFIWEFTEGRVLQNTWSSIDQLPASTPLSEKMSKELKRRGFRFVGPTICYAHMQATGMVNDHLVGCFRHRELADKRKPRREGRA
jgi:DNA-3-methyladenine glycosylase I